MEKIPLISICIPNYNYASYLIECLESVLNQTYRDFEVIFRDNASTDRSFEIAQLYRDKFLKQGIPFKMGKNPQNLGSDRNSELCAMESRGKYRLILASDDLLYPSFLEETVSILERYPNVSMVMTHRDEIDESGVQLTSVPFYNTSCIIPGEQQAAVFMKSGIAIPGQRIMRVSSIEQVKEWICTFQVANDWYYNALMSCVGDIAYLNKPLMKYRVHSENETNESENNMTAVMEHYQIIHKIAKVTSQYGYHLPQERLSESIQKLGSMCLRYGFKMLNTGKISIAKKYLNLSKVFDENIEENEVYQSLFQAIESENTATSNERSLKKAPILQRQISYSPPAGSITLISYREKEAIE